MSGGGGGSEGCGGAGTMWWAWHHVAGPGLAVPAPPRARLVSLRLCALESPRVHMEPPGGPALWCGLVRRGLAPSQPETCCGAVARLMAAPRGSLKW